MTKIVIFDTDGMVINREMYFSQRYSKEFNISPEKMLKFFNNEFQLCLIGKADLKKEISKYLKDWHWTKSVDDLLLYWFQHESNLDQNILASIKKLKDNNIKCYLNTNNEKYRVSYLINNLKLDQYFDGIFASSQLGFQKPQPEFWQKIYEKLNKPNKSEILVWDDDEKNVESAQKFGFQAELYTDFNDYKNKIQNLQI